MGANVGYDKALKRVRALGMVADRIRGATFMEIGAKYHVSEATVGRQLDWARNEGLIQNFEDQIVNELVPLAITAYKKALETGDTYVAEKVLTGMGVLKKQRASKADDPEPPGDIDLEVYLMRRSLAGGGKGNAGNFKQQRALKALEAGAESPVVEGELLESADAVSAALAEGMGEADGEGGTTHPDGFVGFAENGAGSGQ